MIKDEKYQKILEMAKSDPNALGMFLSGSMGKGLTTANSDYDIDLIVEDMAQAKAKYGPMKETEVIELNILSLDEFRKYADWDSAERWDRYNFAHLKTIIDRTGEIQKLIDEKGAIPADKVKGFVSVAVAGFMNSIYRWKKNLRDKNILGANLDLAEALPYALDAIYGMEGRVRPYNKYLEWELKNYPLKLLDSEKLLGLVKKIEERDAPAARELFELVKELALANGAEDIVHGWDGYHFG